MRMSKKFKGYYISCLPSRIQAEMKREVLEASLKLENVSRETLKELTAEAMASRVADVENLIKIEYF